MPSDKEIYEFTLLLRHFQLYKPEELYKVICPFHNDKNASMQISIPKVFYYCYGCGAKGSSLELFKAFYEQTNNTKITELQAALKLTKLLRYCTSRMVKAIPYVRTIVAIAILVYIIQILLLLLILFQIFFLLKTSIK